MWHALENCKKKAAPLRVHRTKNECCKADWKQCNVGGCPLQAKAVQQSEWSRNGNWLFWIVLLLCSTAHAAENFANAKVSTNTFCCISQLFFSRASCQLFWFLCGCLCCGFDKMHVWKPVNVFAHHRMIPKVTSAMTSAQGLYWLKT